MTRRVLIFSANSMIGSAVTGQLLNQGDCVFGTVRSHSNLAGLEAYQSQLKLLTCDVRRRAEVEAAVAQAQPEFVIFLSSTVWSQVPDDDYTEHFDVIVGGLINVIESCRTQPLRRFVYAGSAASYGHLGILSESMSLEPETVYGAAKAAAAKALQGYSSANGFPAVELRLFTPFGPWEAPYRLIPYLLQQISAQNPIELTAGTQRRDFVYVKDVADAFDRSLTASLSAGEVINIGAGRSWSILETAEAVRRVLDSNVSIRAGVLPTRSDEILEMRADIRKAEQRLGWRPRVTLEDAIQETWSWLHEQPRAVVAQN